MGPIIIGSVVTLTIVKYVACGLIISAGINKIRGL